MTYAEVLDYMYSRLPMYQSIGKAAVKKDLTNTLAFLEVLHNPHRQLKTIHVAGTNGKGTTSHSIAAVLQSQGYRTGLYTSPHLKDFTERIRVSGVAVTKEYIIDFITQHKDTIERIQPSFFEITVVMAFDYFVQEAVDIAVIEVGLGGRLDSTNVITPMVSVITQIGLDHQDMLGETLVEIAREKAGIIKQGVPVIVGDQHKELRGVFQQKADMSASTTIFAEDHYTVDGIPSVSLQEQLAKVTHVKNKYSQTRNFDILGEFYLQNLPAIFQTFDVLRNLGWEILPTSIESGLSHVKKLTGLKGRWQILGEQPLIVADVGHNEDGIRALMKQVEKLTFNRIFMVLGGVNDKDWHKIIPLLPPNATFYLVQPRIPRAMDAYKLQTIFNEYQLISQVILDVNAAVLACKNQAQKDDLIFIGGSTFVVAELNDL